MSNITPLPASGFVFTEFEAHVVGTPDSDAWYRTMLELLRVEKSCRWWIGDALLYGENKFGGKVYAELEAQTGVDSGTLANCKSLSLRFPPSERQYQVTWSHYATVAALPTERARELLSACETEGLSTRALIARIKADLPEKVDDQTDFDQRELLIGIDKAQEALAHARSFMGHRRAEEKARMEKIRVELVELDKLVREELPKPDDDEDEESDLEHEIDHKVKAFEQSLITPGGITRITVDADMLHVAREVVKNANGTKEGGAAHAS